MIQEEAAKANDNAAAVTNDAEMVLDHVDPIALASVGVGSFDFDDMPWPEELSDAELKVIKETFRKAKAASEKYQP